MRNLTRNLAAAVVLSLVSAATPARADQPKASSEATRAGAEFAYFVGTWKCDEKWSKTDFSPAYDSTATLVAADNTNGVWVAWSYVQDASPKLPHPPSGNDLWGYDPTQKIFVRDKADSFAPGVTTRLTSKGFVGDTIAWEGQAHTPKGSAPFKHTFTRLDDHTIEGKLYIAGQPFYTSKCTKR